MRRSTCLLIAAAAAVALPSAAVAVVPAKAPFMLFGQSGWVVGGLVAGLAGIVTVASSSNTTPASP